MLSMDSGNAHIAAMLGVKVITLFTALPILCGFRPFNQPMKMHWYQTKGISFVAHPVYGNKIPGYEDEKHFRICG
jgi:ADP-heptose:LPS heptosyltransferase